MKLWTLLQSLGCSIAHEQPWIALGLAGNLNADNAVVAEAVETWLRTGGRAVDTALMYYNDEGLREGMRRFLVDFPDQQSNIFVSTKIPPEQMGFHGSLNAIKEAQSRILAENTALDCVLIHWPGRTWPKRDTDPPCVVDRGASHAGDWSLCRTESWAALQEAKALGLVKLIGVSNYELPHLEEMNSIPDILQVEFHPWWIRGDLLQWCRDRKVKLVAYSSLGGASSNWLEDPLLKELARQEHLTVAQLLLNWAVSQGVSVIPSARSKAHMQDNLHCCEKPLSAEILDAMSAPIAAQHRTIQPDPRWIHVPGVSASGFGGPVPPSHAHLNLFGAVERIHLGSLRKHCWEDDFRKPYPCCDPSFGVEGLSTCWDSGLSFMECCLPSSFSRFAIPLSAAKPQRSDRVDFVVVGAGSAGSLAASRIARSGFSVVLVESGGDGLSSKKVHPNPSLPEQFDHWFVHNVEWSLGEVIRTTQIIHGRGLGGSSSVNGRIYTRTPLPFAPSLVSAAYADVESELLFETDETVSDSWQQRILDAVVAAGVPHAPNASMLLKPSIGPVQKIAGCRNGGQLSAFHCAQRLEADIEILRHAHVNRVIFGGNKAVGVEIAGSKDSTEVLCNHGVVLSAGALQTPAILVRSGIGHPLDLRRLGIDMKVESQEVGANLQDHPYLPFRVRTKYTCATKGSLYAFYSNLTAQGGQQRVYELQLIPRCLESGGHQQTELKGYLILLRSMKGGRVVVRSTDPAEPPAVLNNPFAGDGGDAWLLLHGLREVYQRLKASLPGASFDPPSDSIMEDSLGGQYCAQHLGLWQHPMGSARIGPVLDNSLRVRGVEGLYVADASALPDWALAGHPDAAIRALGALVAQFATQDALRQNSCQAGCVV